MLSIKKRNLKVIAIIVAAGEGKRTGRRFKKQFYNFGGMPLYLRTSTIFINHSSVDEVIIALPEEYLEKEKVRFKRLKKKVLLVCGGKTRGESVWNALSKINEDSVLVLIHDGVRPFISNVLIDRVISATMRFGAAVPVIEILETVKILKNNEFIESTAPREKLRIAQTPQGFFLHIIKTSYLNAIRNGIEGSDDSFLVELQGFNVKTVKGERQNLKITTNEDLLCAEYFLKKK